MHRERCAAEESPLWVIFSRRGGSSCTSAFRPEAEFLLAWLRFERTLLVRVNAQVRNRGSAHPPVDIGRNWRQIWSPTYSQ